MRSEASPALPVLPGRFPRSWVHFRFRCASIAHRMRFRQQGAPRSHSVCVFRDTVELQCGGSAMHAVPGHSSRMRVLGDADNAEPTRIPLLWVQFQTQHAKRAPPCPVQCPEARHRPPASAMRGTAAQQAGIASPALVERICLSCQVARQQQRPTVNNVRLLPAR